jgi:hypothetical protein
VAEVRVVLSLPAWALLLDALAAYVGRSESVAELDAWPALVRGGRRACVGFVAAARAADERRTVARDSGRLGNAVRALIDGRRV